MADRLSDYNIIGVDKGSFGKIAKDGYIKLRRSK